MAEPANKEEYLARSNANTKVDGYGLDVATHMPCPWCAEPDFMVLYPAAGVMPGDDRPNINTVMSTEHTCAACGRSGKNIIDRTASSVTFEFVQTGGPDGPPWLVPPPRRV